MSLTSLLPVLTKFKVQCKLIVLRYSRLTLELQTPPHYRYPVFSLNFSSAGKGPFMASKAKNMHFPGAGGGGEWGSGVRGMALPFLGNLGAKFSETLFPHFKTYFTQIIGRCYL